MRVKGDVRLRCHHFKKDEEDGNIVSKSKSVDKAKVEKVNWCCDNYKRMKKKFNTIVLAGL